ncbi:DUF1800 family protein [Massilia sp. BJB1822]|uniref:DUF1800 domain-containing protein n=1 Tax=Massilia sp. BJB1822 TaxID=2744470 RepID=UPI0015948F28|nr:DUF1800 domain-containing protein [Massilia sp. BJB1822]NVD97617.1 DUF1800 domain-containing protein [Massilia sp. BJB1822]
MPAPSVRQYSITFALLLTVCGGSQAASTQPRSTQQTRQAAQAQQLGAPSASMTPAAASRFLAMASFGPDSQSISHLASIGAPAWLNEQFGMPLRRHRSFIDAIAAQTMPGEFHIHDSLWQQAIHGPDQLRQRVAYALSQIFVISTQDENIATMPRGAASYYDVLAEHAFGNYRQLLKAVALHPMMGIYMSHMKNQKEGKGRIPDENFAREIMQLMSIGLHELNQDGSLKLAQGRPIETYNHEDVAGLAKVFTGWSWAGGDQSQARFFGQVKDPNRDWRPMQHYAAYHSSSAKRFLGASLPEGGSGEQDLDAALDVLFRHPNTGPFIGRQLIQRLVTSNPSPAYVGRVAAAFRDNGSGVRGDMRALIKAVLLDPEAQNPAISTAAGKLREPVLRLANWMRAFKANSASGQFRMWYLDDTSLSLGQTPLRAPSVFNFFRPSYAPPGSALAAAGLVAPEFQLASEPTVIGYLNYMQKAIVSGVGRNADIRPNYAEEVALAERPELLVERVNLLLLNGRMPASLKAQITAALNGIIVPASNGPYARYSAERKLNRVHMAIYLALAAPEYLIQQ